MGTILSFVLLSIFFWKLGSIIRISSKQLNISPLGGKKIPHLILKLAKADNVDYKSLAKDQKERVDKIYERLTDISSLELTFIHTHNLVHVFMNHKSYFGNLDTGRTMIVNEKLGNLTDDEFVEFIIMRRGSVLTGYLNINSDSLSHDSKEKIDILFEFPTQLLNNFVLNSGSLEKKYNLEKNSVADVITDDFGETGSFHNISWKQSHEQYFGYYFSTDK